MDFTSKKLLNRFPKRGFTIIELMVTIAIMGILTVILIPAMRSFDQRNKVMAGIEGLKSAVAEAKNYAMSPRYGDTNADRYAVRISSNAYELGYCQKVRLPAGSIEPPCSVGSVTNFSWKVIYKRAFPVGVIYMARSFVPTAMAPEVSYKEIAFKAADSKVLWDGYDYVSWPISDTDRKGDVKICPRANCASNIKGVRVDSYTGQISIF